MRADSRSLAPRVLSDRRAGQLLATVTQQTVDHVVIGHGSTQTGEDAKISRVIGLHPRRGWRRRRDAARVWGVIIWAGLRIRSDRVHRGQSLQGVGQGWGARWRQGTMVHFVIVTIAIGMDRGGRVSRERCTHQVAHSKLAQRGRCSGLRCACSVLVQGQDVSRGVGGVPVDSC